MTRIQSTYIWGIALMVAGAVLGWQKSFPWALTATGAVAVLAATVKVIGSESDEDRAKAAADRAARVDDRGA